MTKVTSKKHWISSSSRLESLQSDQQRLPGLMKTHFVTKATSKKHWISKLFKVRVPSKRSTASPWVNESPFHDKGHVKETLNLKPIQVTDVARKITKLQRRKESTQVDERKLKPSSFIPLFPFEWATTNPFLQQMHSDSLTTNPFLQQVHSDLLTTNPFLQQMHPDLLTQAQARPGQSCLLGWLGKFPHPLSTLCPVYNIVIPRKPIQIKEKRAY
jgi:hypothetical protein